MSGRLPDLEGLDVFVVLEEVIEDDAFLRRRFRFWFGLLFPVGAATIGVADDDEDELG